MRTPDDEELAAIGAAYLRLTAASPAAALKFTSHWRRAAREADAGVTTQTVRTPWRTAGRPA